MMVEFLNILTGTRMFVDPEREVEYLMAGHTRVVDKTNLPPGGDAAAQAVDAQPKAQAPATQPKTKTANTAAKKKPAARRGTADKK